MDVSRKSRKVARPTSTEVVVDRPFKRSRPTFARQIGAAAGPSKPELKDITTAFTLTSGTPVAWSTLQHVNPIPQGTTASSRVGRKLVLKSIAARFVVNPGAGNACRWMIVYDHAPNGALPLITDVLSADSINGHVNLTNSDRFMILHDEYINQFTTGNTWSNKYYRKFTDQGLQSQWTTATTGTIADVVTGAIYCLSITSAAAGTFSSTVRVRFTDM